MDQSRQGEGAGRAVEGVQRLQRAAWSDLEDRATVTAGDAGPAVLSCPVEVPIGGLDQPRHGGGAIRAVEAKQRLESLRSCPRSARDHQHERCEDECRTRAK